MSTIATFYSYKGGVGRSMALANVAVLLARQGLRVLAVDWDLEAPGLERYFDVFELSLKRGGLLPFLAEQSARLAASEDPDPARYADHLWRIHVEAQHPLCLLGSGRFEHSDYARLLERFEWPAFFERGGGEFLEQLRERWRADFDVTLVDSRTGMSDAGGICTIQIPDVLVTLFTANHQSLTGVRDVIQSVKAGRQSLAYDRMALTVLPVPCRLPRDDLDGRTADWLGRIAQELGPHVGNWLPEDISLRRVLERVKLPQDDAFAYGERLAVLESDDASGALATAYGRIAALLGSDFRNIEASLSISSSAERVATDSDRVEHDYRYDVFVSYRHTGGEMDTWVQRLCQRLAESLQSRLGRPCRFFLDTEELPGGSEIGPVIAAGLRGSRLLLALLNPPYFASPFCLTEWQTFEERERATRSSLIIPLSLGDEASFPVRTRERQLIRIDRKAIRERDIAFGLLDAITEATSRLLEKVPAYDSVPNELPSLDAHPYAPTGHRILLVAATPVGTSRLALDAEAREIDEELRRSRRTDGLTLHTRLSASPSDLVHALHEIRPTIVHFSGHGSSDGIFFEGDDGLPQLVSGSTIRQMLTYDDSAKLVVLNGCYSARQAREIRGAGGAVIGIPASVGETAARAFVAALYRALANDLPVTEAFRAAEAEVSLTVPPIDGSMDFVLLR